MGDEGLKPKPNPATSQMGKHLILDFVNVTKVDLNNYQSLNLMFAEILSSMGLKLIQEQHKIFEV